MFHGYATAQSCSYPTHKVNSSGFVTATARPVFAAVSPGARARICVSFE